VRRRGRFGFTRDSRETTLANGRKKITQVANMLKLGSHFVDSAFRLFTLAVEHNFVQGRKTLHIVAACLYIVCRTEKTPIMLIDLSDVLRVNVFDLGKTFVKLHQLLYIKKTLPIVDPALFIQRYAGRLELGDKTHAVCTLAIKITAQMDRDWIQTGRRPAGICAVALQVACNTYGVGRSREDIRRTLRVSEATVTQRMREFEQTPAALMTIDEFSAVNSGVTAASRSGDGDPSLAIRGDPGRLEFDPPSFINNRINDGSIEKMLADARENGLLGDGLAKEPATAAALDFPLVAIGGSPAEAGDEAASETAEADFPLVQSHDDLDVDSNAALAHNMLARRLAQKSKRKISVQVQEKVKETAEMYKSIEQGLDSDLTETAEQRQQEVPKNGGGGQRSQVRPTPSAPSVEQPTESTPVAPSSETSRSAGDEGYVPPRTVAAAEVAADESPVEGAERVGGVEPEEEDEEDTFSDLDDSELDGFIMTEDEVKKKTAIWTELNKAYLAQMEAKKKAETEEKAAADAAAAEAESLEASGVAAGGGRLTDKNGRRKRKRISTRLQVRDTPAQGFADVLVKHRLSRKINYDALKGMFADDGSLVAPSSSSTASAVARARGSTAGASSAGPTSHSSMPPPAPPADGSARSRSKRRGAAARASRNQQASSAAGPRVAVES
jgi:transcription factor IIIB subunit 2